MTHPVVAEIIREKAANRTLDIEMQVNGAWVPLGGHGCYTDDEVRDYVGEFHDAQWPIRARAKELVYPDVFPSENR